METAPFGVGSAKAVPGKAEFAECVAGERYCMGIYTLRGRSGESRSGQCELPVKRRRGDFGSKRQSRPSGFAAGNGDEVTRTTQRSEPEIQVSSASLRGEKPSKDGRGNAEYSLTDRRKLR